MGKKGSATIYSVYYGLCVSCSPFLPPSFLGGVRPGLPAGGHTGGLLARAAQAQAQLQAAEGSGGSEEDDDMGTGEESEEEKEEPVGGSACTRQGRPIRPPPRYNK